jgi:hypothetical protein
MPTFTDYAPFPTYASFIYAERCITTGTSSDDINFYLDGMHSGLFCKEGAANIPFKSARQLLKCVDDYANLFPAVIVLFSHLTYTHVGLIVCRAYIRSTIYNV